MKILLFVLKRNFLSFFKNAESTVKLVLNCLYILLFLINGIGLGYLFDMIDEDGESKITVEELSFYVLMTYGFWLVLLEFLPVYRSRSQIVSRIYPTNSTKRWLINFVNDFFKPTTIAIFGSFVLMNFISKTYKDSDLLRAILFLLNITLCMYILKTFVETSQKTKIFLVIWLLLIASFLYLVLNYDFKSKLILGFLVAGIVTQTLISISLEKSTTGFSTQKFSYNILANSFVPAIFFAFFKNPKSRSAFVLQLIFKVTFVVIMSKMKFMNNQFFSSFLIAFYISPLILFTYITNNIWGFFPEIWLTTLTTKPSEVLKNYFRLICIPLVIDFLVTFMILVIFGKMDLSISIFYVSSLLLLSSTGIVISSLRPLAIDTGISFTEMKSKTSGIGIFVSMLLVLVLTTFKVFIWSSILGLLLSSITFYLVIKNFKSKLMNQYHIFETLQ